MSWKRVPLGTICHVSAGGTPSRSNVSYFEGSIPWVKISDMLQGTVVTTEERISEEGLAHSSAKLFPAGTLLLSIFATVGRTAVLGIPAATNQAIAGITPRNASEIHQPFLRHYLDASVAELVKKSRGVAQVNINLSILKDFQVPLPPLEEQRRIATVLDQAEELRAKRRASITLIEQLPQAIFIEMFGDPVSNPMGWPIAKLCTLGALDRGVSKHRPRNAPELLGGVHPLIQTGDVANSDGYIRSHTSTYSDAGLKQSKKWPAGTLCITIAANIAKTGILTFDACFPDSVVGFKANIPESVQYVRVWLSFLQKTLEDAAPESAQKNINLEILRNLPIPVPPPNLQSTFTDRVNSTYQVKASKNSADDELGELYAALQTQLLGGAE